MILLAKKTWRGLQEAGRCARDTKYFLIMYLSREVLGTSVHSGLYDSYVLSCHLR